MKSINDAKEEKIRYETVNFYFYYVFINCGIDNGRLAAFAGICSRDKTPVAKNGQLSIKVHSS